MGNEQVADLKQFFLGAIAQATANMITKDDLKLMATKADIKNMTTKDDLKSSEQRLKQRMDKGFKAVDTKLDEVLSAVVDTMGLHIDYVDERFDKPKRVRRHPKTATAS